LKERKSNDGMKFTHLLYVRKFSMFTHKNELFVYAVNTNDIYHTIGEIITSTLEHIERIDYVELTPENEQAKFDYWKSENKEIYVWQDKYKQTADVQEVKHGEWKASNYIKQYKHTNIPIYACSVCGEEFCDVLAHHSVYRYCPNCGARMDGKEA
jgi:gamma-glutamylcyclotransferase (GGCT)/AIG2-like uncharacterized protein YtfP/DNA-directed RNA polymerase subunit RPC12/RpoP